MRRSIIATAASAVASLVCLGLAPGALAAPTSTPVGRSASTLAAPAPTPTTAQAEQALVDAHAALAADGSQAARRTSSSGRPDATLALRDLFLALPRLDAAGRREAAAILARPTDGADDRQGDGYRVPARSSCAKRLCIHWVRTTRDAPPSRAWVNSNLSLLGKVWRSEVGRLGYRAPRTDGHRGGNGKLDVYLKDLGSSGVYGYCAPERRAEGRKWLASGYCVLDNDFARSQYAGAPRDSLRVTAAHEFFHAVQFAYDYGEDPWLMEGTATWMEERVADRVNDNRQYIPYGQLGAPGEPLDTGKQFGFNQYGNWPFFEYLSGRFGENIVRSIWTRAGAYPGSGHTYSTAAVSGALKKHGGFLDVYRSFAGGNVVPATTYAEGRSWPAAPASDGWRLSQRSPRHRTTLTVNHMASRNVVVRPAAGLKGKGWSLQVTLDGPGARTAPAAYVVVRTTAGVHGRAIRLDADGRGTTAIRFGSDHVRWARVVAVNASTRFSCWHRTTSSCQGHASDNKQKFAIHTVVRRGD